MSHILFRALLLTLFHTMLQGVDNLWRIMIMMMMMMIIIIIIIINRIVCFAICAKLVSLFIIVFIIMACGCTPSKWHAAIFVYMYIYVNLCIYIYIYIYTYIHMYAYMFTCIYVYMHTCMYMYVCSEDHGRAGRDDGHTSGGAARLTLHV